MSENYASKVIAIAEAEVGYLEKKNSASIDSKTDNAGYNNYTKYARDFDTKYPDFYNGKKQGAEWCDIFVDWCLVNAFGEATALTLLGQPKKSCGAGCSWSVNYYKKIDCFHKSTPRAGDQIFFCNSSGDPCHTGLVYKVDSSRVYTIEGNTSSEAGVVANGGAVAKKSYSLTYSKIYGYGRPKYDAEPKAATSTGVKKSATVKVTVKANDKVKAFQAAAIADGYKSYLPSGADGIWGQECENLAKKLNLKKQVLVFTNKNLVKFVQKSVGMSGSNVDGKFGATTKKYVTGYQSKNGLEADGIVGYNTLKKMCGVK